MTDRKSVYAQFLRTRGVSTRSAELLDSDRRIERSNDETLDQPKPPVQNVRSPQSA